MATIAVFFGWFFAIFFGLITISMLMLKNWARAFVLLFVTLLCLPPLNGWIKAQFSWTIHPLIRLVLIAGLLFIFSRLLLVTKITSIYKSPKVEARFQEIYDQKMTEWPTPYEDIYLDTQYGKVHVIASGPKFAPPMLLLHASAVSGWSWKYNVEEISKHYRTYAIDLIGDAGKSEFTNLDRIMKDGRDQAVLYAEIADMLEVGKAFVVGASEGGFIASNYALHYPEKVEKMALLGPMGYAGATQSVIRITLTQLFPLKPLQDSTFKWAFSDSAQLKEDFKEWFPLIMTGYNSVKVAPMPLSAQQRQSIQVPVMFIFGERDNLVGDPAKAKALVQDIPNVRVEVVRAGHLMAGERPEEINQLLINFFGKP